MSIKKVQAEYHTAAFQAFMIMFKSDLETNHEKLDVAQGDEILHLQGENRYIKRMLQLTEKREIKYSGHDGAFGVN
jgi:hypothetical protein